MNLADSQKSSLYLLLTAVSLQFVLGIFTLIYAVPISLGLIHQLGAFVLLGAAIFGLHRFNYSADN